MKQDDLFYRRAFLKKLAAAGEHYDQEVCLLKSKMPDTRNYHSKTYQTHLNRFVHGTCASAEYGAALLYAGDPELFKRGVSVLDKILTLQDTNPESPSYGIWSYYYEEPLPAMRVPDWNWADFIGKNLLYVLMDHRDGVPADLLKRCETAVRYACHSIMRRDIGLDYTNINLMGAYVTVKAGECLGDSDIFQYGKNRLKREWEYVTLNGGFTEYNSPAYTPLALEEIGRMLRYFKDPECLSIAEAMNDLEWKCLAMHYHAPSGQLAGPHSRCYNNLVSTRFKSFIDMATERTWHLTDDESFEMSMVWYLMEVRCPRRYFSLFGPLEKPRLFIDNYYKQIDTMKDSEIHVLVEKGVPPVTATTYMTPLMVVGTLDHYDLWAQRRPLLAYFGTPDKAGWFRFRCLHDRHDYASAVIQTVQVENHVAAAVHFVKDHGDFHYILQPLDNGKITMKRLAFRFEVGGYLENVIMPEAAGNGGSFTISAGGVSIEVSIAALAFDGEEPRFVAGADDDTCWVDIVIYEGEEKVFDFNALKEAYLLFGVDFYDGPWHRKGEEKTYSYWVNTDGVSAEITMRQGDARKRLSVHKAPGVYAVNPDKNQEKVIRLGGFAYKNL